MASKVLLVEDDNNLREIYQARLQAEGYDIVSAKDGEEALVIAKQEQPDLIISDVMMPRVSGFEMLDILRNTEGLKDPKVIMLTALGQADDKNRADELGADRYLVKSQVTLEDIVKAAQDLLNDGASDDAADDAAVDAMTTSATSAPAAAPAEEQPAVSSPVVADVPVAAPPADVPVVPEPVEPPAAPTPEPVAVVTDAPIEPSVTPAPTAPGIEPVVTQAVEASPSENNPNDQLIANALKDLTSDTTDETENTTNVPEPVEPPAAPTPEPEPTDPPAPAPEPVAVVEDNDDSSPVAHKKIISPISTPSADTPPDINELLAKEEAKSDASEAVPTPPTSAPTPVPVAAPAPGPQGDVQSAAPHQPGHVISPTPSATDTSGSAVAPPVAPASEAPTAPVSPTTPTSAAANDTDPNSIAL